MVRTGRPRDEGARQRLLAAAYELSCEARSSRVSVEAIARRAGAGRQTIYRWWPSRESLILDALLEQTLAATGMPATDDVRRDFADHLIAVVDLFGSPAGAVIKDVVGEAQRDAGIATAFEARFWAPRRQVSLGRLQRAVDSGDIPPVDDPHLFLDALYGPLWLRLLLGHEPMSAAHAEGLVALLLPDRG
jgi:AcrR family transcriptional regulator